jgi:glycosyltransferase involved in cell wall biosynthesis
MARIAFIEITATVSYGGIQTAVWKLAEALAALGHEVSVFGGAGSISPPVSGNITVHTFPFTPRERVPDLGSRFQRIVERLSFARHARATVAAGRYDWVVLDKPFDFFWPWLLPKSALIRFAFTSGGTDFFAFDRRLARRIHAMFACSHFNSWQIRSHYKRPVSVMYYGVDSERFAPHAADAALRARLGASADTVLFAFAGRLVGWKGMQVAVQALTEPALHDVPVKLLIIGDGPERPRLEQQARALGISGRVIFHDPVPHDQLPALYAAADAGVFPSIGDEAFGITIAEAMSCGRPVIGSCIGGIPEVVGNEGSCGLLVAPGNPKALAETMRTLALDPALRARLGACARRRIETEFTWAASARRLLAGLGI